MNKASQERSKQPNYWARRAIAVSGLAAASLLGAKVTNAITSHTTSPEPDRIVSYAGPGGDPNNNISPKYRVKVNGENGVGVENVVVDFAKAEGFRNPNGNNNVYSGVDGDTMSLEFFLSPGSTPDNSLQPGQTFYLHPEHPITDPSALQQDSRVTITRVDQ